MSTSNCLASTRGSCRYCRYFTPEGRRGGHCEQLGVPVQSKWKACMLALPPFAPSWSALEQSIAWHPKPFMVQEESALASTWNYSGFKGKDSHNSSHARQKDVASMPV